MLFNTSSREETLNSISKMLSCNKSNVIKAINESKINELDFSSFIESCNPSSFTNITELTAYHITARKNKADIYNNDLLPLHKVLTSDSDLSRYLKSNEIEFKHINGDFEIYYKNKLLHISDLSTSINRLGGESYSYQGINDINVNGFLFKKFNTNLIRNYIQYPEILLSLGIDLELNRLGYNFSVNRQPFCVTFKVPIEDIDEISSDLNFGFYENMNLDNFFHNDTFDKFSKLILAHSINFLVENNYNPKNNPIIYINREKSIPYNNILYIDRIESDGENINLI